MKPWPLLMIGVYAFLLALLLFGVVLVASTAPAAWVWGLNALGLASSGCALGYWWREAFRAAS